MDTYSFVSDLRSSVFILFQQPTGVVRPKILPIIETGPLCQQSGQADCQSAAAYQAALQLAALSIRNNRRHWQIGEMTTLPPI
jgi:hypothetical protein